MNPPHQLLGALDEGALRGRAPGDVHHGGAVPGRPRRQPDAQKLEIVKWNVQTLSGDVCCPLVSLEEGGLDAPLGQVVGRARPHHAAADDQHIGDPR